MRNICTRNAPKMAAREENARHHPHLLGSGIVQILALFILPIVVKHVLDSSTRIYQCRSDGMARSRSPLSMLGA
jgi:hypothetical protein